MRQTTCKFVAAATKLKITQVQQAAYAEALIVEAGGDPSKFYSSYSTAYKARRQVCCKIATTCWEKWIACKLAIQHWD